MDDNSEFAEMYQDVFQQTKLDRELDVQKIEDVHERFEYLYNKDYMANKPKDPRYDTTEALPNTEEEEFSTDLDEDVNPADQELY